MGKRDPAQAGGRGESMDAVLWAVRLDRRLTEAETEILAAGLPPFWRERAMAREGLARQEALCAYALLQEALWETAGWPHLPETALTARGKPWFPAHPEVHFSISHTRGAALAAVAGEPVGVDMEQIRPLRWPRLQARLGKDLTETEFFRLWVRREARAKRRGQGLGALLGPELPWETGEVCTPLEIFPGYDAALAAGGAPSAIHRRSLEELVGAFSACPERAAIRQGTAQEER